MQVLDKIQIGIVRSSKGDGDERPTRNLHGFRRGICACSRCQVHCRHLPGALDPHDLSRLCPPEANALTWAEEHLRARIELDYPVLVPVRRAIGYCHWYLDGRCLVHADAPYGCAFFDTHMTQAVIDERVAATVQAIRCDRAALGPYYQTWLHLCRNRLIAPTPDRNALERELYASGSPA